MNQQKGVVVIGGAGFIGSNIVHQLVDNGYHVTVIDGLFPHTGSSITNLSTIVSKIDFIDKRLEEVVELDTILENNQIIIAAFGWTSHKSAFETPMYDLDLNLKAHIFLLSRIRNLAIKPFLINLGSSVQFGKIEAGKGEFENDSDQYALDVQGIHKIAAEAYYRIFSKKYGINSYCLRIPNCFGPNQKKYGDDIGLIGSFINDALQDNELIVFGSNRKRSVLFVYDLVKMIGQLCLIPPVGFIAYNLPSHSSTIKTLAETIIKVAGKGELVEKEIPTDVANMDFAGVPFNSGSFHELIPNILLTPLDKAIEQTVNYFKE